jgi:hypothetical protein
MTSQLCEQYLLLLDPDPGFLINSDPDRSLEISSKFHKSFFKGIFVGKFVFFPASIVILRI